MGENFSCDLTSVNHCLTATVAVSARNSSVHCSLSIVTKKTDLVQPKESTPLICTSSAAISSKSHFFFFLLGNIRIVPGFVSQEHKMSYFYSDVQ